MPIQKVDTSALVRNLTKIHSLSQIPKVSQKDIQIPLSILQDRNLGALESIVIYLKDNLQLSNNEIAKLTNRDNRTIWATYHKAKKKIR